MPAPAYYETLRSLLLQIHRPGKPLVAVEVGAGNGELSKYLLTKVPGLFLHMIDHWRPIYRDAQVERTEEQQKEIDRQSDLFKAACKATDFTTERRKIWRMDPLLAVREFGNFETDLIYLASADGVSAWWPKVRARGILCGQSQDVKVALGTTLRNAKPIQRKGGLWFTYRIE